MKTEYLHCYGQQRRHSPSTVHHHVIAINSNIHTLIKKTWALSLEAADFILYFYCIACAGRECFFMNSTREISKGNWKKLEKI